ncbi:Ankyrin repeat-containing domain containing protein [Parasponia andersonii]|uniref:Ankyrin repeat-containing domain containing protein n=1 Tax=Parasponia andersonii TaxID=3476 RepID=A0A2P5C088_PARAD|nr:Ankyrin repeat-containing domain containing protein [Parasponia andersonii]
MVDKILKCYPVAIDDADQNMKNILLLAAENRQLEVYKLLMKNSGIPKDIVFRKVDNHRNSALHFAAMIKKYDHKPWPIPRAALQMQWEIKWYKFLDKSRSGIDLIACFC